MSNCYFGFYRAQVTSVSDPKNLNRIKALVPQVLQNVASGWAYPLISNAPTPKIGDIVFVTFEGGDLMYPLWIGKK